jgi:voltage-gated potassium channel
MAENTDVNDSNAHRRVNHIHSISYDLFILVLTILSLFVTIGLILSPFRPSVEVILLWVDFILCAIFFYDFLLTLWHSPNKIDYFVKRGGWLDLLGTIPTVPGLPWTAVFRLARLNRLVRIIRRLRGGDRDDVVAEARENPAQTTLLTTIIIAILLVVIASLLILRFERGAPGAGITSGATAFWWAIVTMTTVGYGDYVPVTYAGRLLAIGLMIFGIGIFAVLTSFMASKITISQDDQTGLITELREENALIRAELAEIKSLLKPQGDSKVAKDKL